MRIRVRLRGGLAQGPPGDGTSIELEDGATVGAVLDRLGLPAATCVCTVNGAVATRSTPLRDGDRVEVHPPMAGG